MAYSEKIFEAQKKALNQGIATKILDLMDKLRLNSNNKDSKRWIWELLQNAKDVSNENNKVKVKLNLDIIQKVLEFSHNGKPFNSENITFLIEQVSTKDRKFNESSKLNTIGKFGTGFLTTHLLSEIVSISGVLKETDEPYKKIDLVIDRSGRDIDSIIQSVEHSIEQLHSIDSSPNIEDYDSNELNTKFTYKLNDKGIKVAEQGIMDLLNNIIFTLVFLPEIESLYIENKNIKYELKKEIQTINEFISLHTIIETNNSFIKEHKIISINKNNVTVAVQIEEIQNRIFIKKFSKSVPKLFCHFPLIGTESFPFPFIINSPNFNPTEPRDGVYLTDIDEDKIIENKLILSIAQELYYELLIKASEQNWGNMHLFADNLNLQINEDWLSIDWIKKNILNPIKNKLIHTPIVDTHLGQRVSILDEEGKLKIWFPAHKDSKIRNKIWKLCSYWIPEKLPVQKDIDNWYSVLWTDYKNLTLNKISENLEKTVNVNNLESILSTIDVYEWINCYFNLLNEEENFIEEIIGDKYSVIPNQNGIFKNRTDLNLDKNIDEELKNVLAILGEDYREKLLHKKIFTGDKIQYSSKEQKDVINKINELISNSKNKEACFYMISLFSIDESFPKEREEIYNFCRAIFKDQIQDKKKIMHWSIEIWESVDKIVIENLVTEISNKENLDILSEKLQTYRVDTLKWLNDLISFLNENDYGYLVNDKEIPILPNQNGVFLIKDDLFLDDGTTDNTLKDISKDLGIDIRKDLLCVEIFLDLPDSRTLSQKDIADEISKSVKELYRDPLVSEETKKTFRKLLLWFNENKEEAIEFFSDLYKNKYKLYDDTEIAENMEKSIKYDEIMDKFNIKDYKSLENILENKIYSEDYPGKGIKQELTEDMLVQMGISSLSELQIAFKDKVFSDNFIHISNKDLFKFEYVQKIIDRSIDNVFKYLESKSEYNIKDCEQIAKTIYSVTKNGEEIYIIIRPSDYDQIIIYYDSEKDLLDYEKDCELWVDNGDSSPQKITFGKILKITGINKIPLRKIV
ncbi:sacsin N-terminal ATP-binding-like domain-containing protein [Paenisporosarcina quisquiliarum]|uniref:sacsin N-terminal ATP-binding-like domain-containing protein n=1 Tax=Paenisporosarcina quisquiliarum TaxID=365346 RepID=UPI003736AF0E